MGESKVTQSIHVDRETQLYHNDYTKQMVASWPHWKRQGFSSQHNEELDKIQEAKREKTFAARLGEDGRIYVMESSLNRLEVPNEEPKYSTWSQMERTVKEHTQLAADEEVVFTVSKRKIQVPGTVYRQSHSRPSRASIGEPLTKNPPDPQKSLY